MQRKILLIVVGALLLFAMELGYSVAIHNEAARGGSLARKKSFELQGPVSATLAMFTHTRQ
jgi:hypothetical protein